MNGQKKKNDELENKDEPTAWTHSSPHPLCNIFTISGDKKQTYKLELSSAKVVR